MVLKPESPSSMQTPAVLGRSQENTGNFQPGYFIVPKEKRGMDEDYFSAVGSRKPSGNITIKFPYSGNAAGVNYEVIGIEHKDIISICDCKIKICQVGLLEDPSPVVYSRTVQQLLEKKPDGKKYPPALHPVKGTASVGYPVSGC